MIRASTSRLRRLLCVVAGSLALLAMLQAGGCYYMQAVGGQLEVLRKREPIERVLEDPALPADQRERLTMVLAARRFAVDELMLPDNDSYRSYTDLQRDYVVWNVFAAPEFSLQPKTWCFPVVGCVAYRGYFSETAAQKHAKRLEGDGYDVFVGGVPAYSTLGRFDDPLLNTMMRWSDADLVSTLFHELAHQKLFVKGDTAFNESFATAVAETGLSRWLKARGEVEDISGRQARAEFQRSLSTLANATRSDLERLYDSSLDDSDKRHRKQALLDDLSVRAEQEASRRGLAGAGWLTAPLNNARLASTSLYRGHLPAFRLLLVRCREDIACFYREANRLAELLPDDRHRELETLVGAAERQSGELPGSGPD